ncbi:MAG: hypothetical protein KA841_01575 [Chitinophagales bacterium]|nr:hypothetical protein [Chitinophagales bacterium]
MTKSAIQLLVCLLVIAETTAMTYMLISPTDYYRSSSWLYFLCGIAISMFPLLGKVFTSKPSTFKIWWLPICAIPLFTAPLCYFLPTHFSKIEVYYKWADMLPRIQIYVERFLTGDYVYKPVTMWWGGVGLPPYLPAVWLPFIPSNVLGFDMRWTTVACYIVAMIIVLSQFKFRLSLLSIICFTLLFLGLLYLDYYLIHLGKGFWVFTYEGLIVLYYVLLLWALAKWKPFFIGFSIAICLLSRFSLVTWIPFFMLFLFVFEQPSFALKTAFAFLISVSLLFLLPFYIGHSEEFSHIIEQYRFGSINFWNLLKDNHQINMQGMHKMFGKSQYEFYKKLHLLFSVVAPFVFLFGLSLVFPNFRNRNRLIAMCSLKFTLVFFFCFIDMPFFYVFIPPTIISYMIAGWFISESNALD